jgi:hypothetical protein
VNTQGVLSGSLAHALNPPLGIILGNAPAAQDLPDHDFPDLTEARAIFPDIVNVTPVTLYVELGIKL